MLGPIEDALNDHEEQLALGQRERILMVQRNGLRMHKLVNTLFDFSRVEAGRIQALYEPTDLSSMTTDLVSNFRSACEKAGLLLTINANGVLKIDAQRGFDRDFLDYFREVSAADDSAGGRALRSRKRIIIEDVELDAPYEALRPVARAAGYRAV